MQAGLAWLLTVLLLAGAQAALSAWLPAAWLPGVSLLGAAAAALVLAPVPGLLTCAALGFFTGALSEASSGMYVFLRVLEWGLVRRFEVQFGFEDRRSWFVMVFLLTILDSLLFFALSAPAHGLFVPTLSELGMVLPHAFMTALFAAPVLALARRVHALISERKVYEKMLIDIHRTGV